MNICIIGHGNWGKDALAEYWRDKYNLSFQSSSAFANEKFIFDTLKNKYGYETPEECFNDRRNHREEWANLITAYNTPDKTKLARELLETSDAYIGMRDPDEVRASIEEELFDHIFWIDASKRLPPESKKSCGVEESMADTLIDNNGTLEEFYVNADEAWNKLITTELRKSSISND